MVVDSKTGTVHSVDKSVFHYGASQFDGGTFLCEGDVARQFKLLCPVAAANLVCEVTNFNSKVACQGFAAWPCNTVEQWVACKRTIMFHRLN
ncbi:hypothetical protein M514_06239 [Trichuris suis]|uniref:Uncharacterized protein n=1 Tax=Trichuris suis TaxID=68888 RepID=A0A085M6T3_9BILA|nr:hypothetical protein M513_06239 [Trichuris suis]KFD63748.1 hypothetical protein M514_06239 [Trichuris suis]